MCSSNNYIAPGKFVTCRIDLEVFNATACIVFTGDVVEQPCSEAGTLISALVRRAVSRVWQPEETGAPCQTGHLVASHLEGDL
jgi:hypothetical protein